MALQSLEPLACFLDSSFMQIKQPSIARKPHLPFEVFRLLKEPDIDTDKQQHEDEEGYSSSNASDVSFDEEY
ncbi:hypothetical protein L798_02210 [Zootermopsis nevadensis]|uniref:Uncharacterized protein n=1 Tax=Zootermopsis nevadensis TaxID=136037 RepID=A0A067QJZ6_ZOONE|nr:hypothetical protein L798_02210 [Zootermopsis nevadensis]